MSDKCLYALEQLELENQRLLEEKTKLEDYICKLQTENKDLKDTITRFKVSIEKFENSMEVE